jgi:hypothetical protein
MILQIWLVAVALAALGVSVSTARSDQYPTLNTAPVCHGITDQSDLQEGLRNVTLRSMHASRTSPLQCIMEKK